MVCCILNVSFAVYGPPPKNAAVVNVQLRAPSVASYFHPHHPFRSPIPPDPRRPSALSPISKRARDPGQTPDTNRARNDKWPTHFNLSIRQQTSVCKSNDTREFHERIAKPASAVLAEEMAHGFRSVEKTARPIEIRERGFRKRGCLQKRV